MIGSKDVDNDNDNDNDGDGGCDGDGDEVLIRVNRSFRKKRFYRQGLIIFSNGF